LIISVLACVSATRLDAALVSRGLCGSRAMAKQSIQAGLVSVDGAVVTKVAHACEPTTKLTVEGGSEKAFVSRAGEKLHAALQAFDVDVRGANVLDIGASTGGFTDCLLSAGAAAAVCVDCGHGQLHPKLAASSRVTSLEGINARSLTADQLPLPNYETIVVDVSFISLQLILPALWPLLDTSSERSRLLALVKPQFEAGSQLGDDGLNALRKGKGVLTDAALHSRVLDGVTAFATSQLDDCELMGTIASPITGGDGNREFLACFAHRARPNARRAPAVSGEPQLSAVATVKPRQMDRPSGTASDDGLQPRHAVRRQPSSAARAATYHARRTAKRKGRGSAAENEP